MQWDAEGWNCHLRSGFRASALTLASEQFQNELLPPSLQLSKQPYKSPLLGMLAIGDLQFCHQQPIKHAIALVWLEHDDRATRR